MKLGRPIRPTPEERFWAKVVMGPEGCHIWTGAVDPTGYGRFSIAGRGMTYVHRWAYEHFVGPIPAGLDIDHQCHNRSDCRAGRQCLHRRCVRRDHLEPATRKQNLNRGRRRTLAGAA